MCKTHIQESYERVLYLLGVTNDVADRSALERETRLHLCECEYQSCENKEDRTMLRRCIMIVRLLPPHQF